MKKNITEKELISLIEAMLKSKKKDIIIAIDGRCASGKTTLGEKLKNIFGGNLFHADDYFLRPFQRTEERLALPGGNFDKERFTEEIIAGILSGKDFSYTPFDCSLLALGEKREVKRNRLSIIEGSYSCHPEISESYDMKIFVTTDKATQESRILSRNKDKAPMFFSKWIPLEEKYFSYFGIEESCDYLIVT